MKYDILTIGSGTRDVFLVSNKIKLIKSKDFPGGVGECLPLGGKVEADELYLTTGGGATNAAVTFSRLGLKTATLCRLGDDEPADDVLRDLERENVDTSLVRRVKGGQTGYSTLITAPNGERSVLVYRGVSSSFTAKDVPLKSCQLAKWTYLTSLGGNFELSKKIVKQVAKCKNKIMWNPGGGELSKGMTAFKSVLKDVDVINMNKEEAQKLTKKKSFNEIFGALTTPGNIVIITDGPNGTRACRDGECVYSGTTGAKSISRTGAGDAFGSGFLASLIKTDDLTTALAVGTLNAEGVIQSLGAKRGILKKWPSDKDIKKIPIK